MFSGSTTTIDTSDDVGHVDRLDEPTGQLDSPVDSVDGPAVVCDRDGLVAEPVDDRDESIDGSVDGSVAAQVLASVREHRRVADAAEAALLADVLAWCRLHVTDDPDQAATWGDTPVLVGGEGCPWVSEFTVTELATALKMSLTSGRGLVADVVELAYRLPRLWGRVQAGTVPAWRARRVAQRTSGLSVEAAGFVDAQVVGHAARIGITGLDRLVETALARYQPEQAAQQRQAAADGRRFDVHHDQVSLSGTSWVEGQLDLADAVDLDAAIGQVATQLQQLGCPLGLDQRRALAAGQIARTQLALNLQTDSVSDLDPAPIRAATGQPATSRTDRAERVERADLVRPDGGPFERVGRRDLTLYAHLSVDALTALTGPTGPTGGTDGAVDPNADGTVDENAVVTIEGHGTRLVTVDTLRDWLSVNAAVRVTIRPVLDLNADLTSPGRFPTPTHREQVVLRDRSCVAPHCQRPARHLDLDHIHPWPDPGRDPERDPAREPGREPLDDPGGRDPTHGSTSSSNLAVLCRHHHRAKTFTNWGYEQLLPAVFLWHSPHGLKYLTYPGHTIDLLGPVDAPPQDGVRGRVIPAGRGQVCMREREPAACDLVRVEGEAFR